MADELTDLTPEDVAVLEDETSDADAADEGEGTDLEAGEDAGSDPDTKLARHLNIERLPEDLDPEFKDALSKRLSEIRSGIDKHSNRAKELEAETAKLRSEAETLRALREMPEFREFLATRGQKPKVGETEDEIEINRNSQEYKVLRRAVEIVLDETGVKSELSGLRQTTQTVREREAMRELERLRSDHGDDWEKNEPAIIQFWQQKGDALTGDEAFFLWMAREGKIDERARRRVIEQVRQKKQAGGTLKGPGPSGAEMKALTDQNVRELTNEEAWALALKQAEAEERAGKLG